jgi:hypothetical protein
MNPSDNAKLTNSGAGLAGRIGMPGGHGRSLVWAGCLSGLLIIFYVYCNISSKGEDVRISANVPSVTVVVDGKRAIRLEKGSGVLKGVPYGARTFKVDDMDYLPAEQKQQVTWMGGSDVKFELTPRPIELTVRALPGSEVLIDQTSVGQVGSDGQFKKGDLLPGERQVTVRLEGYQTWEGTFSAHLPGLWLQAFQPMTGAKMQQIQAQSRRAYELANQANRLYQARQYRQALAAVNEALALNPHNQFAQHLKARIEQTLKVLGE